MTSKTQASGIPENHDHHSLENGNTDYDNEDQANSYKMHCVQEILPKPDTQIQRRSEIQESNPEEE